MNLHKTAIQLFLTAAVVASNVSAFVLPSSGPVKTAIISRSAPSDLNNDKPQSLAFVTSSFYSPAAQKARVSLCLSGTADNEDENTFIKEIKEAIELLESITGGDDADILTEAETAVPSRKFVTMENDPPEAHDAKEAVQDEKSQSFLRSGIDLLTKYLIDVAEYKIGGGKMQYATYPRHPEYPDVDLSWMMKMMDGPPPPEYLFSLHKIRRIIRRVLRLQAGLALTKKSVARASAEEAFEKFFTHTGLAPKPRRLIKHWESDKEFARQFLAGVNPVMINVAKDLSQLSTNIAAHFGDDKLQGLINEKRLFFVSYDELKDLAVNPHYPIRGKEEDPRPFYAPIIVFELDSAREELDILGIQLDRSDDAKIYTKDDEEKDWLFAKMHVASSDSNIHEWVSHLGKTHLTMEPHIIAIHNTLKHKGHPLNTFFAPLVKDTLFLNWAARKTLAGYTVESFGDMQSSIGIGQFLQVNKSYWSTYSFFESSGLPTELESRGFDKDFDMPSYLYREDGLRLWDAYGKFAANFVDEIYDSDKDVASDDVVQEWAEETCSFDKAAVPGFPSVIKDKATLVKIMQTLMWVPSGLHAAMNFPQYDYYAYCPNKPMFTRKLLPASSREDIFENGFANVADAEELIQTVSLLTLPSEDTIDKLDDCFAEIGKKSYETFQAEIDDISDDIEKRNSKNKRRGNAVYSYLNPAVVPASIDI